MWSIFFLSVLNLLPMTVILWPWAYSITGEGGKKFSLSFLYYTAEDRNKSVEGSHLGSSLLHKRFFPFSNRDSKKLANDVMQTRHFWRKWILRNFLYFFSASPFPFFFRESPEIQTTLCQWVWFQRRESLGYNQMGQGQASLSKGERKRDAGPPPGTGILLPHPTQWVVLAPCLVWSYYGSNGPWGVCRRSVLAVRKQQFQVSKLEEGDALGTFTHPGNVTLAHFTSYSEHVYNPCTVHAWFFFICQLCNYHIPFKQLNVLFKLHIYAATGPGFICQVNAH